jgi:hypothetical protein
MNRSYRVAALQLVGVVIAGLAIAAAVIHAASFFSNP